MLSWYCVSSGVEYCSRKNLLLANCWRKLKRISFLHWSYDRIWRRLLRISWNYQWLSYIFWRLQQFWPWLGRLQGARWRTPTCLDGCRCLPSCQNQSWDKLYRHNCTDTTVQTQLYRHNWQLYRHLVEQFLQIYKRFPLRHNFTIIFFIGIFWTFLFEFIKLYLDID